jgi:hypothetical protein
VDEDLWTGFHLGFQFRQAFWVVVQPDEPELSCQATTVSGLTMASAEPSGVTSKPANGGHFTTGQRKVAWD